MWSPWSSSPERSLSSRFCPQTPVWYLLLPDLDMITHAFTSPSSDRCLSLHMPAWIIRITYQWAAVLSVVCQGCHLQKGALNTLACIFNRTSGKAWSWLFFIIPHGHGTMLHLQGEDINFLLAVAVFVQQILTLLIHYSQCIVGRAMHYKGISRDDMISRDWFKAKTLRRNLSPCSQTFLHEQHACATAALTPPASKWPNVLSPQPTPPLRELAAVPGK